ncbi:GGDEF domain-containing protein [Marinibactrum halimedae]|uniref:diguanylate cyclase n=1 Tax=Marinibactrum halimedae TaxID=1444977 RepID=A0AA37T3K3_9GAMM|nr:GGDEF domain-containing protein [Marinibactrum halimedae]MCD9458411.1 GGDEF domain-containing protein [Marinibactrum halimedae]GLS26108.1 GGDEF domain-containing protein [Marinibactrum halimedae]
MNNTNSAQRLKSITTTSSIEPIAKPSIIPTQRAASLLQTLHRSLEIDATLNAFYQELSRVVEGCSMTFNNNELNLCIEQGPHRAQHECTYNLREHQQELGRMTLHRHRRFNAAELANIELYLSYLYQPLRNAIAYQKALRSALVDPLTNVGNRKSFSDNLERELQLSIRYQIDLSLLVIDLDHFKQINDQYGHSHGDQVLQAVATVLKETSRRTDMVFRYGGEEFVILLPKTPLNGAIVIAERMRGTISLLHIPAGTQTIRPTASIGVASARGTDSATSLFDRADANLYQAKEKGRNCVISAPQEAC